MWLQFRRVSTRGALLSSEIQQGVEQQLLGAGVCEADSQQSPITAQLYATASLWANHNGPEEPNGNEASLMLANQERGLEASNSSGGKPFSLMRSFTHNYDYQSNIHNQNSPAVLKD